MKSTVLNFLLVLCLLLAIKNNARAEENSSFNHLYAEKASILYQQQEPKKQSSATINPAPPQKNLWKSVLEFLRFRYRANKRLDTSIYEAIKKLQLNESIAATSENVRQIIAELKKRPNVDSLNSALSDRIQKIEHANKNQVIPEAVAPTNEELSALVNQLMPLLNKRVVPMQDNSAKNQKLRALSAVRSTDPKTIYSIKIGDSVTRKYRLQINNRAEVYGFYDAGNASGADPFFNAATSLIYYALPLNESTGDFDNVNNWNTTTVIDKAQKKGSKVYFTVLINGRKAKKAKFLSLAVQRKSITNILALLRKRGADGINISYKYLPAGHKEEFSQFVKLIHDSLKAAKPSYKIFITIPRTNFDGAYDVAVLNPYTDRYFIDFGSNTSPRGAPLAPLKGEGAQTIEASYTWYVASGIQADKLIIILPYRGINTTVDPVSMAQRSFSGYLPFYRIKKMTKSTSFYSEENESVYIDTVYSNHSSYRIWYDDEFTLSKKYDYVLNNNVAGIGLYYINYDNLSNVLNNELMYKFSYIDTTYITTPAVLVRPQISFFEQIRRHAVLWNFILQHPCSSCFQSKLASSEDKALVLSYLNDLQLYSLVKEEKEVNEGPAGTKKEMKTIVSPREIFNYVNNELNRFLKYLSLIFLFFTSAGVIIHIWGLRYHGAGWSYRKLSAGILIFVISLLVLFVFTYCFTSDEIPIFGTSAFAANSDACVIDLKCVNIPYYTLLGIIVFCVIVLGFPIYRFLITPLIKKDDLP